MSCTLLVLAAGMGSRYGGLKQLDGVGPSGETILEFSVYDAIDAGFDKLVFVIRRDFEAVFREQIAARFEGKITVEFAFQELTDLPAGTTPPPAREKPWGTAHAVYAARNVIDGPFGIINADDFYGRGAYRALAGFLKSAEDGTPQNYCIVAYQLENTLSDHGAVSRGVCTVDGDNILKSVKEHTKITRTPEGPRFPGPDGTAQPLSPNALASMNLWGFTPGIFPLLEKQFKAFIVTEGGELKSEFMIPVEVDRMVANGLARVHVLRTEETWFGVTYREDKEICQANLRARVDRGEYPENLRA